MQRLKHELTAVFSLAVTALLSAAQAQAPSGPAYVVYDTTTLGGTFAFGSSVNDLGWIAGASLNTTGELHAALSIPGNVIDLGTLGGSNSAVEWPVKNDHGIVAGVSESATPDPNHETFSCADFIPTNGHTCLPFLWQNGSIGELPLLGGNNGFATGVNNAGLAVGWAETAVADPTCVSPQVLQFLAVQWGPGIGPKRVLPPWGTDSSSAATAINDVGEAVGISGDCDVAVGAFSARHALLWLSGRPVKLPTLGGAGWNTPMAISNSGLIVGFSDTPGDDVNGVLTPNNQAVLWTRQGIVNLHTLPGDATAQATGVNDFGQIVGTSFAGTDSGASRVFLWQNGQIYDLNTLLQPNAPLYLVGSGDINNRGEITGVGCVVAVPNCAVQHTFIAIPAAGAAAGAREAVPGALRPYLPADSGVHPLPRSRFGHMQAERDPRRSP